MKKVEEQVLAPHKHMAKTASPHHPHSMGLVYTPKGKEEIRPIDTADAGYGGEAVSDAEGGEADAGIASKKAVAPMPMQTLVKVRKMAEQFMKDRRSQSPENAVRRARLDAQQHSKGNVARAMGAALEEKKLTKAEMKKREEIAQAIERDQPGMDMSKKMAIATATAKRVAEDYRTQKAEKSQSRPSSNTAPKSVVSRGKVFTPEEAESIDELKKSTLASYAKKATDDATYNSFVAGSLSAKDPERLVHDKKAMKRQTGVFQAINRLAKEEAEQVHEAFKVGSTIQVGMKAQGFEKGQKLKVIGHDRQPTPAGDVVTHYVEDENGKKRVLHNAHVLATTVEEYQVVAHAKTGETFKSGKYKTKPEAQSMHYKLAKSGDHKKITIKRLPTDVKESWEDNGPAEENDMAMTQLHFIVYAAQEIMEAIKMGTDMEEWYQNKLSKVHSDMEGLHSYMEGRKRHKGSLGDPVSMLKLRMSEMPVPRIGLKNNKVVEEEVWDKPMPDSEKQGSLTPEQKAKAKARAAKAGRKYPNMIDNMWASKQ